MRQCRSEIKIEEDTASIWDFQGAVIVRQKLIAVADSTAQLLGKGNIAVFNDLYWQFLAYEDGGIKQMKALHADKELSAAMLKNWMTLDADPWKGNLAMFRREQQDILQPLAFDRMNSYVAQKATEAAFSLFPGATAFNKLKGKSIAVFDDRWTSWITPKLWPEWKKFSESVPAKKYLSFIMKELSNPLR